MTKSKLMMLLLLISLVALPTQAQDQTTFSFAASRSGWVDTGFHVEAGEYLVLSATGGVNIWPNCEETKAQEGMADFDCSQVSFGPSGTSAFDPAEADYPLPGANVGAMVGRIGEGTPFIIGDGTVVTVSESGTVFLAFNDNAYMEDNQGSFTVTMTRSTEPVYEFGPWRDTGVMLEEGQTYTITATGTINIWPNCEETKAQEGYPNLDCALMNISPEGTTVFDPALGDYPLPGANVGLLVGRIGDGDVFAIGPGGTFTATGSGPLLVAINDTQYWQQDDERFFDISVLVAGDTGTTVTLPGTNENWSGTGFVAAVGDSVTITATGQIDLWPDCEAEKALVGLDAIPCDLLRVSPVGSVDFDPAPSFYPLPGAPVGALIGRFGPEGIPFVIGEGGTFTAESAGELEIRVNDTFYMQDNMGNFSVTVE